MARTIVRKWYNKWSDSRLAHIRWRSFTGTGFVRWLHICLLAHSPPHFFYRLSEYRQNQNKNSVENEAVLYSKWHGLYSNKLGCNFRVVENKNHVGTFSWNYSFPIRRLSQSMIFTQYNFRSFATQGPWCLWFAQLGLRHTWGADTFFQCLPS